MRTIIIDDERLARKELKGLLKEFTEIEVIDECSNVDDGIISIKKHNPDLIFLDINMPEKNGFDLLQELDSTPRVIFVTAYDEYALKAFEVNALDYLMKPVDPARLEETIRRIVLEEKREAEEIPDGGPIVSGKLGKGNQIFLKDGEKCWFVNLEDIRLFESEGNYVRFYFHEFKPLILKSLNNLEERLEERLFFRVNRKYIVNLTWIEKVENWFNGGLQLTLKDGVKVEVSRRQAAKFKDLMSL
ncbi:MAG: LytTR family transcriptional regulator DNA-binding domain-containing protein [Flavobacteriales bacterium]|nr:LytTR family transcriptional regulator DNA-binding domain-containing protein [Flavobacteriales bacterium]